MAKLRAGIQDYLNRGGDKERLREGRWWCTSGWHDVSAERLGRVHRWGKLTPEICKLPCHLPH